MNKVIMTVKATGQKAEVNPFNILDHIEGETKLSNGVIVGRYKNSEVHIDTNSGNILMLIN